MAHGRVSVVLGVQSGLSTIIRYCDSAKGGKASALPLSPGENPNPKNRLSDSEIVEALHQVIQVVWQLKREQVGVNWIFFDREGSSGLSLLLSALGISFEASDIISISEMSHHTFDALVYVPLDVQQPKQVEQLARLSMLVSRALHVAFSASPKWNHAQLMALRETWTWIDFRQPQKITQFAEELIRMNGGLTSKDLAKISLPQFRKEESMDPIIITRSAPMREVLSLVDAVADTDSTILVSGDSGTGKELIAQRIHYKSHRLNAPIVAVNCGAIPEELLESELFGHVKGAFTGAVSNREGRFEAAENGTLFLDEIGEMGPNLQVKLLRVLQTRTYEPVGSTKSRASNVRIIAATNRDLENAVQEGRFREDLYYRLNVIPIHIPGLKDRKEDVALLVDHFVKKFNKEKSRRVTGVTRASIRALVAYDWPGNVRELENLMERMVILKSSGMIDVLDFPEKYRRKSLSEIEYDDLMNPAKNVLNPSHNGGHLSHGGSYAANQSSRQDEAREEGTMKYSGTFTKGRIDQTIPTTAPTAAVASGELDPNANSNNGIQHSQREEDSEGSISVEQAIRIIADRMIFPNEGLDFNSVVDQFENILILQALERTGWNRNRAAGLLRLNRTTLVEKLKKKQLMPPVRYGDSLVEGNA